MQTDRQTDIWIDMTKLIVTICNFVNVPKNWNTYIHTHAHTHTYIHACIHTHIHTYTHTYMHAYTHTHTLMNCSI